MILKVRGKIPALVKIFKSKLRDTIIVTLAEGGKITINTDGSTRKTNFSYLTKSSA